VKTVADRAAEAVEAAEMTFAEEMGATLDLSPAAKMALIVKSQPPSNPSACIAKQHGKHH